MFVPAKLNIPAPDLVNGPDPLITPATEDVSPFVMFTKSKSETAPLKVTAPAALIVKSADEA